MVFNHFEKSTKIQDIDIGHHHRKSLIEFENNKMGYDGFIHGKSSDASVMYKLTVSDRKYVPRSLRMFTGSLRSLPECFEVKSENRWFWMMIAISWILLDFHFVSKSIDLLTSGRFGRLIHFSCWVLTIIDEDPTFLPRIHTKKFQNPYRNVSEGFLSSNKQKSPWLAQIGSESLSADERRRTLRPAGRQRARARRSAKG